MIPASMLRGLTVRQAECFGKPHFMASYSHGDAHSLDPGASCAVCGRPAESAHHEPPKGFGGGRRTWAMRTPMGTFVLRPALIALCGSGTTGCHGKRHSGLLRIDWEWDDGRWEEAWWSGEMLSKIEPHDPGIYEYGRWVVDDGEHRFGIPRPQA